MYSLQRSYVLLIEDFMQCLSVQTRSQETLRAYGQDLHRFQAFLSEVGVEVADVKPSTISAYLASLEASKIGATGSGLAPATVVRRLAVVSQYFDWLQRESDDPVRNPAQSVKRPKVRNVEIRSVDDSHLETLVTGITSHRDRAIVLLFVYSGFRLSELRSLDKETITARRVQMPDGTLEYFGEGEVLGKGGKKRPFRVGPKALQAVGSYISSERQNDNNPALFLSSRSERLSCRAIQHIVNNWCKKLGVPHIHPHQLRHSFATRSINGGMSSTVLQELMGHASLATTQRYFHMKGERISREYFATMEFVRQCSPV
jgi:site-specific recombinase XerD